MGDGPSEGRFGHGRPPSPQFLKQLAKGKGRGGVGRPVQRLVDERDHGVLRGRDRIRCRVGMQDGVPNRARPCPDPPEIDPLSGAGVACLHPLPHTPARPVLSELKARLQQHLTDARKARDKALTLVLSTTLSELRNKEIDLGREANDEEVQQVVTKAIKQRRDAAEQMRAGGREELAQREDSEAELLSVYLPEQLDEAEVRAMIQEIVAGGAAAMGAVMGQLMPRIRGKFDGKAANALVREALEG